MSGQLADLGLYPFDYGRFFNQCEQALPEKRMKYKRPYPIYCGCILDFPFLILSRGNRDNVRLAIMFGRKLLVPARIHDNVATVFYTFPHRIIQT
jgi:hypothetical protein